MKDAKAISSEKIAQYYDANTGKFLRYGGSGKIAAIHRAIWAPGVKNADEAFNYLNALVAEAVSDCEAKHSGEARVLDLGCGVGGTALYLANTLDVTVTGITISSTQCELAKTLAQANSLEHKAQFITADFESLPPLPLFDAAYAIESFVHSRNPASFIATIAAQLSAGGRLIICDDFAHATPDAQALRWITRFKRGWQLNSLLSVEAVCELAEQAGLRLLAAQDLSPYLRQFPEPYLWFITQLTRLPLPWAYWQNLSGGTALQRCVQQGWTQYHALIWEKI